MLRGLILAILVLGVMLTPATAGAEEPITIKTQCEVGWALNFPEMLFYWRMHPDVKATISADAVYNWVILVDEYTAKQHVLGYQSVSGVRNGFEYHSFFIDAREFSDTPSKSWIQGRRYRVELWTGEYSNYFPELQSLVASKEFEVPWCFRAFLPLVNR